MPKPRRAFLATAGAAIGIVVVLVSISVVDGSPVFWEHYGCVRGELLASQYNWTPVALTNAPYGGAVFSHVANAYGGVEGGFYNGSVLVDFFQLEWNLSSVDRVLVSGPGPRQHCPTYDVTGAHGFAPWAQSSGGGIFLLGPGNTSDVGVPTQFNFSAGGEGLTSVIFHDAFVAPNDASVSTCGRGAAEVNVSSRHLDVQIPFQTAHGRVLIDATAYGLGVYSAPGFVSNFTYSFPADFGTWQVDNLTLGPNASGSGLAFSYAPCTG